MTVSSFWVENKVYVTQVEGVRHVIGSTCLKVQRNGQRKVTLSK